MALRPKHARFLDEYLVDLNATQAAIRAGYSPKTAGSQAHDLLKKPEIQAELARRQERVAQRAELSVTWVLDNLRDVAERCLQARPVMVREGKELVQKLDPETGQGMWEFDSSGANRALELLGKHLGAFLDRTQHEAPGGGPLSIRFVVKGEK